MWLETFDGNLINMAHVASVELVLYDHKDREWDASVTAHGPTYSLWQSEAAPVGDRWTLFQGTISECERALDYVYELLSPEAGLATMDATPRNTEVEPEPPCPGDGYEVPF